MGMQRDVDEVDLKILKCMAGDCRLSFRQIARALNVSTSTVSKRIKRLQDKGVILSFIPLVNPNYLGVTMFAVGIKARPGHNPKDIAKEFASNDMITHVFVTTGNYDVIAMGVSRTNEQMLETVKSITSNDAIERYEVFQILEVSKESPIDWMAAKG